MLNLEALRSEVAFCGGTGLPQRGGASAVRENPTLGGYGLHQRP
jgi:hypothetical protein